MNAAGITSRTDATSRVAPIAARASMSKSLRLRIIGATAYPQEASRISTAPSNSSAFPATSMPTSTITPANPISRPTRRSPVARSAWSKRIAITATISGTEAIRIAVSDEDTYCSPAAISGNGSVISITAKTAIQRQRPRTWASTPARQASASSSAAPIAIRTKERKTGETPSSIAILMKRYGTPQISAIATNAAHPLLLMGDRRNSR